MSRSVSLADLPLLVGQPLGVSSWLTVSAERIAAFAEVTEDRQWIHLDEERAGRESPFGRTVAHGLLTLSLVVPLFGQLLQTSEDVRLTVNYGFNRVRFPAPVPAGARVRLHAVLSSLETVEGGYEALWDLRMEAEGASKPVLAAQWLTRLYR